MRTITAQPLPEWESLPDFGLYMDQLLIFTERYLPGGLTAGMVNSYVKNGLVKRPVGKKYDKESLAQILMTGILKAVVADATNYTVSWVNYDDEVNLYLLQKMKEKQGDTAETES